MGAGTSSSSSSSLSSLSLSVGLAQAITALSDAHEASSGVRGSLALWSNVLQYLDGADGLELRRELPVTSCLSKRALVTATKYSARLGLATLGEDKRVRLTDAGHAAREAWCPVADDPALRRVLVPVVAGLPLEHPQFPTQYGTADSSITGGPGQDWKPVRRRSSASSVGALPLSALLSQVFVALAMAYEGANGALGWAANVTSLVPDGGCPLASLPADGRTGLLAGMERHGQVRVVDGVVSLTARGRVIRDRHADVLADVAAALDPTGAVASAVSTFVASRPEDVSGVIHPPTYVVFGHR